eukprot:CAMPEP_0198423052 /NCGR_PEP_ID=MMETSP1452-20131203/2809_1 /TAXON_ID=1181717 /ORGANISM="Synchroma pusillum, Strain CCMP3072" /LENGTH=31 /DNA_ID= /DNA_START= /DNA_END= /DNA_ORIENTATION=
MPPAAQRATPRHASLRRTPVPRHAEPPPPPP